MNKTNTILRFFLILFFCSSMVLCAAGKKTKSKKNAVSKNESTILIDASNMRVNVTLGTPTVLGGQDKKFGVSGGAKYAHQWMMVVLDFSFGNKFFGQKNLQVFPNTRAEFYLQFPLTSKSWFYGVQTMNCILVDPQLKSKVFSVSVFLPPDSVYMYVTRARGDKKALVDIKGVILIVDKKDQIIGRKIFKIGKESLSNKDAVALYNTVMTVRKSKLPVTLWPREKTPWQWIEAERFELPALMENQPAATAIPSKPETSVKRAADTDKDDEEE